jgi:hypothetical protein
MKLHGFPPRIGKWDDFFPHLPEVELQPDRIRIKSPILDLELKIQLGAREKSGKDNR